MIRLQNKVPPVYVEKSRDFQLLCRAYDIAFNAIKFDIDTTKKLTDTHLCRSNMLSLLQTKLGFFTDKSFDYVELRSMLEAFPSIMKYKGSLKAIKQAIYVFLRIKNIKSIVEVENVLEEKVINGVTIKPYTIVISLNSSLKDTSILEELFKYILPTGYSYYFNFVARFDNEVPDSVYDKNYATVIFVSNDVNSEVRGSAPTYSSDMQNRFIGATDTVSVISDDTEPIETQEINLEE